MQVKCDCGKTLNVPDTLAGKSARCPGCSKVFKVPGTPPPAVPATKVQFSCACGKKLSAPVSAAGRKIACPGCAKELTVPKPAGAPSDAPAPPAAPAAPKPAPKASAPAPKPPPPPPAGDDELALDDAPPPPEPPKAAPPPPEAPPEPEPAKDESVGYGVAGVKCPNCKTDLGAGAQFCTECGTNVATGTRVEAVVAPPKPAQKAAGTGGFMGKLKGLFAGKKKSK